MASEPAREELIRAMEPEDLDAVMAIETAAQLTPWSSAHFRDCLGNDNYLCQVATVDDVLVAFLILSRILDETHVLNITVAPASVLKRPSISRWPISGISTTGPRRHEKTIGGTTFPRSA